MVVSQNYVATLETAGLSLNREQQQAVGHLNGPLLVVAGPGSGKTRVITARVGALLAEGIDPASIMVVTFTRAAAAEMRQRIASLPEISPYQARTLKMGTFHGQFYRILSRFGITINVASDKQRRFWVTEGIRRQGEDVKDDLVESLLSEISYHKNNLLSISEVKKQDDVLRGVWQVYEELKEQYGLLDYDDMLTQTFELLTNNKAALSQLQSQIKYLLVDEFQDTNKAQFEVLRLLAAPQNNLCVVGDVDQAIYAWRAAKPEFLLRFTEHYPHSQQLRLDTNYRSTPEIISLANKVIANNKLRHNTVIRAVRPRGDKPVLLTPVNERAEAKSVLTMVKKLAATGIALHNMAVFYRVNRYNHHLVNLLVEENMPFVVRDKDRSLEDHWAIQEVLAFLRLVTNNEDVSSLVVLARRNLELSEAVTREIEKRVRRGTETLWNAVARHVTRQKMTEFQGHLRQAARLNPAAAVDYYLWELNYGSYLQWYARRRGLPADEFTTMCDDLRSEMADYRTIPEYLAYTDKLAGLMRQARVEEGREGALNLMTLHAAKGLEFYAVWIMGCFQDMLPHARASTAEQREEERRLFYVGCTRSADKLTLLAPEEYRGNKVSQSPLLREAFAEEMDSLGNQPAAIKVGSTPRMAPSVSGHQRISPQVNMRVRHKALGEGVITACQNEEPATFVSITFPGGTRKMQWELSLSLGTLKVL